MKALRTVFGIDSINVLALVISMCYSTSAILAVTTNPQTGNFNRNGFWQVL